MSKQKTQNTESKSPLFWRGFGGGFRVWVGLQGILDKKNYQIHDQESKQISGKYLPAGMFSKD
jgi:hypothetical protein